MKKIFGRVLVVIPAIALQLLWYFLIFSVFNKMFGGHLSDILNALFSLLAVVFVTSIVAKRDEGSYKLLWAIVIVAMPVFGAFLYFSFGNKNTGKELKKRLEQASLKLTDTLHEEGDVCISDIQKDNMRISQTLKHVSESTGFPVLKNGTSKYYPFGEDMFRDMCEDLKNAKKYIYVEYFIIESGKFWNTLTGIMEEKAAHGVDVRVIYDDLGSIGTYSAKERVNLSKKGIKSISFNPFLFLKSQLNNRDHRKIMVIDGKVAYSGGVNLADEYINEIEKHGRWKDTGFRITGSGVKSYTYMFTEFWNAFSDDKIQQNLIEELGSTNDERDAENGFILPYYDSPAREEHTSNEFFTELLSVSTEYVWFYTPYLILGDTLFDALLRAAKRGVDVRIIMPGIPDKKIVFRLSRSYYRDLIRAGVKVYEYTPGFVHAKAVIADDIVAGIGTVNLDYRSLFLHFECNSVFYKADIIQDLKKDYIDTQKECVQIALSDIPNGTLHRFGDNILRLISPLM